MANITKYLTRFMEAIYGKDVRQSFHDCVLEINKETEKSTNLSKETETRQDLLEQKYDEQIKNLANQDPQAPEIVDARFGQNTLGDLLKKKMYFFTNVANMKSCLTLIPGDVVQTLGYYEENDGGNALYRIVNDNSLTNDDALVHDLRNGLKARLIYNNNTIIAEQIGMKKNDDTFDNKIAIERLMSSDNMQNKKIIIDFGIGIYRFSDTLLKNNVAIRGVLGIFADIYNSTVFAPFKEEQRYVLKIGGKEDFSTPASYSDYFTSIYSIDGVVFTDNDYNLKQDENDTEKYGLLCVEFAANIKFNIAFKNCFSRCLYIRNCWEVEFENLYMRAIYMSRSKGGAFYIDSVIKDNVSNTSRFLFKNIDLELINTSFLETGNEPNITNFLIDNFSIENGRSSNVLKEDDGRIIYKFKSNDIELYKSCIKKAIFDLKGKIDGLTINQLNIHNSGLGYYYCKDKDESGNYIKYVDSLFSLERYFNISINQINLNNSSGFYTLAEGNGSYLSNLIVNQINNSIYNLSIDSTNGSIIPIYLFESVLVGNIEILKTDCILNPGEFNILAEGQYSGLELFKISGRQFGKIRMEFDDGSKSKYILKNHTSDKYTKFLDKIVIPFNCKLIVRGKMGHNVKLDLVLVKGDTETVKSVSTVASEVNKYKDYVFSLENEDYDYMYLKGQGPFFSVDYVEVQRI